MWSRLVLVFYLFTKLTIASEDEGVIYDKYTGEPVTEEKLSIFEKAGITDKCTIRVKPCDPTEGRRTDGSCNNLNYPAAGTFLVPQVRLQEANYFNGWHARRAADNSSLPYPRKVRTTALGTGFSFNDRHTMLITAFGIWSFTDVGSVHDINYFLLNKTDCCEPEHMQDAMCTPNIIPDDDPVHRYSKHRCMNLTQPLDHQFLGCTNDSVPSPISETTGILDMSQIYNAYGNGESVIRSYEGGRLTEEIDENGVVWPPSGATRCIGNKAELNETKCFAHYSGALLGSMCMTILMFRNHNYYAKKLAEVNPSWSDDQLYYKARDLNIATYMNIYENEWLQGFTGEVYLKKKGLTKQSVKDHDCRVTNGAWRVDWYDPSIPPKVPLEYIYIMRYFHTVQNSVAYKYDSEDNVIDSVIQTQLLGRTGFLGVDDNLKGYLRHLFLQECGEIDHMADTNMAEFGLPEHLQAVGDLLTSDLHKGRTMGMAPYCDYVEYFDKYYTIKTWDDLEKRIDRQYIRLLQTLYKDVCDVDLMVGVWLENNLVGGHIPKMVADIISNMLISVKKTDRFHYERADRPGAYNDCQLEEIYKTNLARIFCDNGKTEGVTRIQRKALRIITDDNPLVDCSEIEGMDFSLFAEK